MIPTAQVNMQELKAAVKELNGTELLAASLKVVGVTKQALLDSFTAGVESVSEEDAGSLTDGIINMYNSLYADEAEGGEAEGGEAEGGEAEGGEAEGGEAKPAAEKAAPKEKKPAKAKKTVEKGPFGSTLGSGANNIDVALEAGGTMEELMAASGCTKARINVHMKFLEANRNTVITKAAGDNPKISAALKK